MARRAEIRQRTTYFVYMNLFIIIPYLNQTGKKNMHQDLLNQAAGSGYKTLSSGRQTLGSGRQTLGSGQRAAGTQLELRGTYIMTKKMRAKRQAEIRFY